MSSATKIVLWIVVFVAVAAAALVGSHLFGNRLTPAERARIEGPR